MTAYKVFSYRPTSRVSLYCKLGDTPTRYACQSRLGLRPRSPASGLKLILVYFPTLCVTGQLRTLESINVNFSLASVACENVKDVWKNGNYKMVTVSFSSDLKPIRLVAIARISERKVHTTEKYVLGLEFQG